MLKGDVRKLYGEANKESLTDIKKAIAILNKILDISNNPEKLYFKQALSLRESLLETLVVSKYMFAKQGFWKSENVQAQEVKEENFVGDEAEKPNIRWKCKTPPTRSESADQVTQNEVDEESSDSSSEYTPPVYAQ